MANENAAARIHQSPFENRNDKRFSRCPLLNNNKMPITQTIIPAIRNAGIFSLRNILERIIDMIGEEQVPRITILMALE